MCVIMFASVYYQAYSSLCKPGLRNSTEAKIFEHFSQRIKGEACRTMCGCLLQVSSDHSPAGPISANRCQQCSTFY